MSLHYFLLFHFRRHVKNDSKQIKAPGFLSLTVLEPVMKYSPSFLTFNFLYSGMSSLFVFLLSYLLPDKKGKTKHKTPIVKRTLNPTFDHKFCYEEVSQDELKERVLEVTIYDFDRASSDEFIGGVRLGLGTSSNEWDDSTEDESQIWHTMLNRANVWIQVVVPLRSSMVSKKQV